MHASAAPGNRLRVGADRPGRVTVVVISRNRRDDLLTTLPRHDAPVILVDNASTDGTAEAVADRLPQVRVVRLAHNLGAPARNIGVELAQTPYVAFADDDSWWDPAGLRRAEQLFDGHPRLGLVAARILVGPEQRLDPVCAEMSESPLPPDGVPGRPVLGFIACGAVVRREAFLQVGGFDEVVFFPGEEERVAVDLAAAGWHLTYAEAVVAHHHPSTRRGTDRRRRRLIARNHLLTAVMRRPWRVVGRRAVHALAGGIPEARGAVAAVPRLPGALGARRRLPEDVERRLALLESG
ncbi:MAG: glycosyltransferase [Actinomycetota bacterium]|nr:glycosyltransferase [Actinomycetota bacterium]